MVFDSSSDAIFLVQPETNFIITANLRARELFEIPDGTDLSTTKGFVYHKNSFSAEEIAAIAESLKTTGKWSSEIEYVSMKGREFWGEIVITEFNFHEEKYVLVRITDISERKEKLAMMESLTGELRETNNQKDKFISILAHDLRGPFHPLLNSLELLDSEYDSLSDDEKKNFIKNSFETANNQYHLLESILSWSRASQNNFTPKSELLKIHQIAAGSIQQVTSISDQKGIIIENRCDQTVDVIADREMTLTILRNLLTNAIKFSQTGSKVVISTSLFDGMVVTSVVDNGLGIRQERLDKMFDITSAKSTPGTNREKGSGLGLLICKELTEKMGGKISVESEQNRGTTVSFTLPAAIN
ncbi:MAG: PAS domain-containing sensor histidine kinase [Ignavibacteriales bacterium]|nr:PAS domain-containing sensor histidine kinase [Ignavibacteriales bacterium]